MKKYQYSFGERSVIPRYVCQHKPRWILDRWNRTGSFCVWAHLVKSDLSPEVMELHKTEVLLQDLSENSKGQVFQVMMQQRAGTSSCPDALFSSSTIVVCSDQGFLTLPHLR